MRMASEGPVPSLPVSQEVSQHQLTTLKAEQWILFGVRSWLVTTAETHVMINLSVPVSTASSK